MMALGELHYIQFKFILHSAFIVIDTNDIQEIINPLLRIKIIIVIDVF